jgi:hypothetical protein
MKRLNDEEKAKLYNQMLFRYQRLQEEVRLIKSENFDLSESDQHRINNLENQMKKIYNDTKMLYM